MGVNGTRRITSPPSATSLRHPVAEISARHLIEPFRQGIHDRLCCLYASLNAIRLGLHDHRTTTERSYKALFRSGIDFLEQRGMLQHAVSYGMSRNRWHGLVQHLADRAETDQLAIDLEAPAWECPPAIDEIFAWLEASLAEVVCLGKTGPILKRALRGMRIGEIYGTSAFYTGADHREAA